MRAPVVAVVALLLRRYAAWVSAWVGVIGVLVVITLPAYASTYRDAPARRAAVALAQDDAATTLLYGRLPDPGTPGQLFSWEIGTFVTLLVAVMGVLTAVRLTRAAEQDGTQELLRGAGLSRQGPLVAALVVLGGVALLLALVCALGVGARAGHVPGVDLTGAVALGFVVGSTFALMALLTVVLAQLVPTARAARVAGILLLAACFALRAAADTQEIDWLNWCTPLGLRATMQPFSEELLSPLAWVLGGGVGARRCRCRAGRAARAGRQHPALDRARHASTPCAPADRPGLAAAPVDRAGVDHRDRCRWSSVRRHGLGVIENARRGRISGGFLKSQLGVGDPVAAYFGYAGAVIGMVVAVFAILTTMRAVSEEQDGPAEYLRVTGAAPASGLASHAVLALVGSALVLGSTAALTAVVAPRMIDGGGVVGQALGQVGGQWSSVLVLIGPAVFLAGLRPRIAWLAWTPYAVSVGLALLGSLLGAPRWLIGLGAFEHPDGVLAPVLRVLLFVIASLIGLAAVRRRDLAVG